MTRTILAVLAAGACAVALGLAVALWWQGRALTALEAENARLKRVEASLSAQLDQARLSIAETNAFLIRERSISTAATATIEKIRNLDLGECADAQIDADLADVLGGRLLPETD